MGTDKTRQRKIEWFERIFAVAKENDKVLDKKLTLAMFALECFSTKQTGMQILEMFDQLGKIRLGIDGIVVVK